VVAAPAASDGNDTTRALIVGGGPAGDAVWSGLRDGNFDGEIVLVGSEPALPYERPHLSKEYLMGKVSRDGLGLRPLQQYRELGITFMLGERVVDIGYDAHAAVLESGKTVAWDRLCIATGSVARRLPQFSKGLYLRELPDADVLRELIDRGSDLDVIGAGFIGCEVAAVAVQKGCRVRVHEALDQPLLRVLGPELGAYLAGVHRSHGVDMRLGVTTPPALDGPVLVAVGSVPRAELAERAGLAIDRGIEVDEYGRTSMPDVFAAGDATRFFNPLLGARIRVEHFQTAQRQGYMVGVAMAGNMKLPPDEVPWFWSDQYDLNLQYAGAGLPWDEIVVRGTFGEPPFAVFYLQAGTLVAAAGVNQHHSVARARRLMEARIQVARDQLADPTFDLRKLLA
jgi:3-phenylpropionate/trans-cinnamate dioxygenase ferredoxin reductase subunit